ncbi:MAG: DNA-3-methyladenine glycosylase I [Candidatus Cloacimonetes bacterium]|nr:DNA-3-methyladenine glycosylase I [Candidatus Cloacimonadota bacterium]MCB5286694.1 DNA-3-methyladenine glycosylase I [Candidatus Cloacimonadota bacterium]MCK9184780.1 DNA-3-methyladenine glycosylase I [Candidatus Cloacimonadota bacterium]MDY0229014.1 DNA-3-methyladenine glycosylase I [Candidatus Cloacimonadaceae bacterium]
MKDKTRCGWEGNTELMIRYHDSEWGVPVHDDRMLFEFLTLDAFQAGLSWAGILGKRENFRAAFDNFDPAKIAKYDQQKVAQLLQNPGIIRNKSKITCSISNAQNFLKIQQEFGSFDQYIWQFTDGKTIVNQWQELSQVPASSPQSDAMSKDLKARGFKFVGSIICYAFMQAAGMVNDHLLGCFRYQELAGPTESRP